MSRVSSTSCSCCCCCCCFLGILRHKAVEPFPDVEEVLLRPAGNLGDLLWDVGATLVERGQTGTAGYQLSQGLADVPGDLREPDLGKLLAQLWREGGQVLGDVGDLGR